jgi:oxygen-dependent protoporphyrinogen oxidase
MSEDADIVVVGGGVTGLTSAYALHTRRPELKVVLLEARARLGGNIRTERVDEHLIDAGPDSFLRTKPEAAALCRELGLETEFLTTRPEARSAYIVHHGKLERLPAGMVLAVPTRLGPMLTTPLLSFPSKLRVLADVFVSKPERPSDESIGSFLTRRFGAEAASRIGAPLLGGIYAGDITELSVRATFPQLADLEDRFGSVIYGLFAAQRARASGVSAVNGGAEGGRIRRTRELVRWMRRETEHAPSPFLSLRGGLGALIERLAQRLPEGAVRSDSGVSAIEREGDRYLVRSERGVVRARGVVLAAPAHAAARALPKGILAALLGEIPYVSTATVFFAFDERAIARKLDALGFIVPAGESELLAGTWVSSKWESRAPEGSALVRAFLGGSRHAEILARSDAELTELALRELVRLMGPLGEPRFARVYRHIDANPQPTVGHPARLERIRAELTHLPGLALAGAAYDGIGIPDCVRQGRAAAEMVIAQIGT